MKLLSKLSLCLALAVFLVSAASVTDAQTKYPRVSQKAMLMQTVGDTDVMITYHRPNINERKLYGSEAEKALVPYGKVWRTGANDATVFEVTNDVMINGKELKKGKYSFYAIPNEGEWTLIFNKTWDQWGTIYDEKMDALRVMVKPVMSDVAVESLRYTVENVEANKADVHLAWGKARVPFTVDAGDVNARIIQNVNRNIASEQFGAASYIIDNKVDNQYKSALGWMNAMLADGDNYQAMFYKARLQNAMGMKNEAIATAKKAVTYGKANKVSQRSIDFMESLMKEWMAK